MFIELLTKDGASEHINFNTVCKVVPAEEGIVKLIFIGGTDELYRVETFMAAIQAAEIKFLSITREEVEAE